MLPCLRRADCNDFLYGLLAKQVAKILILSIKPKSVGAFLPAVESTGKCEFTLNVCKTHFLVNLQIQSASAYDARFNI